MSRTIVQKNRSKAKLKFDFPTLVITISNKNILVQLIEPITKKTVFTVTSNKLQTGTKTDKSIEVGKLVGDKLKALKIDKVHFNRNGNLYHGRVQALADSVRATGITI